MRDIKIAYIISAFKLPANLKILVESLIKHKSNVSIVICIDRQTPLSIYKEMKSLEGLDPRITILARKKSVYRSYGHVRSSMRGLDYLNSNQIDYDFVFLLTGQDYPIKSNAEIQSFLSNHKKNSFIEYFPLPTNNWQKGGLDRIDRYYIHTRRMMFSVSRKYLPIKGLKSIPGKLKPFGGSGYWILNKKHADYVLDYAQSHPNYIRFFRTVDIPDELFFQTILLNSRYSKEIVNDDLRYIDWTRPGEYPAIIRSKDYDTLKQSKALFARKFDCSVDDKIVHMISKGLL